MDRFLACFPSAYVRPASEQVSQDAVCQSWKDVCMVEGMRMVISLSASMVESQWCSEEQAGMQQTHRFNSLSIVTSPTACGCHRYLPRKCCRYRLVRADCREDNACSSWFNRRILLTKYCGQIQLRSRLKKYLTQRQQSQSRPGRNLKAAQGYTRIGFNDES